MYFHCLIARDFTSLRQWIPSILFLFVLMHIYVCICVYVLHEAKHVNSRCICYFILSFEFYPYFSEMINRKLPFCPKIHHASIQWINVVLQWDVNPRPLISEKIAHNHVFKSRQMWWLLILHLVLMFLIIWNQGVN